MFPYNVQFPEGDTKMSEDMKYAQDAHGRDKQQLNKLQQKQNQLAKGDKKLGRQDRPLSGFENRNK